ncbi:hypothetical protein NHQ30_004412 [Ciborinia camelliae]|nr:hypothetical protein NHQ30_004412 [Ciborinia camelliae]
MSGIGWSAGDIASGLKVVWGVWKAISDGPMSAKVEAKQFFEEFYLIIQCLNDWEQRNESSTEGSSLTHAPSQLKKQCIEFLSRHMHLIRMANPQTATAKNGALLWLRNVHFSKEQIKTLYQQVKWPFERDQVSQLRTKMELYLSLATYKISALNHSVSQDTNNMVREMSISHQELLSSNLKLVSSHLDLVSLITLNLKRVTHPLESGSQTNKIDYPMLRQLEQALTPPQPLRAIEYNHAIQYPCQNQHGEDPPISVTRPTSSSVNDIQDDRDERRYILSQRLENLAMRRVETIDSISIYPRGGVERPIDPLISRLQDMRGQIFDAVGIQPMNSNISIHIEHSSSRLEPENALLHELEAWNQLESRIQREILHPAHLISQAQRSSNDSANEEISYVQSSPRSSGSSFQDITGSSSTSVLGTSPMNRFLGIPYNSPNSTPGYFPTPHESDGSPGHNRALSLTSISPAPSIRVDPSIPVYLLYSKHVVNGFIQSIVRSEIAEVVTINTVSQDGHTEIRHSVDPSSPSMSETSMIPYLDNRHVDKDESHRYRIQMMGSHRLKVTKSDEHQGQKILSFKYPPIYTFHNKKDFLEFQRLIILKEVKHYFDVQWIKSIKDKEYPCRLSTIRILRDPTSRVRYILYFRKSSDHKSGFEEWPGKYNSFHLISYWKPSFGLTKENPVSIFKEPKEPKTKVITLESLDGRPLHVARKQTLGLPRNNTRGSITTIGSQESTNGAYERLQDRSASAHVSGKSSMSIKGLIVEFYDINEFTTKESIFDGIPNGTLELSDHRDPRNNFAELA